MPRGLGARGRRPVYPVRRLAGGQAECAGLRVAGVLALAVVEGRAVGRVDPGDPGEVADAGVAGEGFGAPQGDQRRVGDERAVRAVRCAGVDMHRAGTGTLERLYECTVDT